MDEIVSGAYVFTVERSARGYNINKMATSLSDPANRARFQADEDAYMRTFGMSDAEAALVRDRDWKGLMEAGASIYLLLKIGAAVGHALPQIGLHTSGRAA